MAPRRRPLRGRRTPSGEDGFTLFELLIAITVIAVGLIALVSSFDHSRDLVSTAEKTEAATHQAERELERILALPYASVAHTAAPANDPDPTSPAFYVTGGNYQWDQGSTGPQTSQLVADAAGSLGGTPTAWEDSENRIEGEVHRFITWTGDMCATCAGVQRAKRVTVAVTVGGDRPLSKPVLLSTIKIDPTATG
jgi:prepilin-type N-terminal cleavage/methylation domain-containing protein